MHSLGDAEKERVAERCLNAFSVSGTFAPSVIVATGNRFIDWVESKFPEAQWLTEVPVTAARADGGQWNGTLDLMLKLLDGTFVIIDHKSAPIRVSIVKRKRPPTQVKSERTKKCFTLMNDQSCRVGFTSQWRVLLRNSFRICIC